MNNKGHALSWGILSIVDNAKTTIDFQQQTHEFVGNQKWGKGVIPEHITKDKYQRSDGTII